MDYTERNRIIMRYVCAQCWGHLVEERGVDEPVCGRYGLDHKGMVTKNFVDRKRQEDQEDYMAAREVLREAGIIAPVQTKEKNLRELGF